MNFISNAVHTLLKSLEIFLAKYALLFNPLAKLNMAAWKKIAWRIAVSPMSFQTDWRKVNLFRYSELLVSAPTINDWVKFNFTGINLHSKLLFIKNCLQLVSPFFFPYGFLTLIKRSVLLCFIAIRYGILML